MIRFSELAAFAKADAISSKPIYTLDEILPSANKYISN